MLSTGRITVSGLTKTHGTWSVVDDLWFTVEPGRVTGLLGPRGAGKTTTLRMILGLVAPTRGFATIDGVRYGSLPAPVRVVGAVLDAGAHPGRTGRDHLRIACAAARLPDRRADEVLDLAGLSHMARRRVGGYSPSMLRRLGVAHALVGDPRVLILDEPARGLDLEGIRWLRELLRQFAAQGRTVLVSSERLFEVQPIASDVVIIAAGRLVHQGNFGDLVASIPRNARLRVTTSHPDELAAALGPVATVVRSGEGDLIISDLSAGAVRRIALTAGVCLTRLTTELTAVERVFLTLTEDGPDG